MNKSMLSFANGFLWLVCADALVGTLNGLMEFVLGFGLLGWLYSLTGMLVLTLAPVMWLVLGVFWRLPKATFLPLLGYIWWSALGGMPFPLWVSLGDVGWCTAFVGVFVCGFLVWRVRVRHGAWLLPDSLAEDMPFRWKYTTGFTAISILLVPFATALWSFYSLDLVIRSATAGYIHMNGEGLQIEQREYVRAGDCDSCIEHVHLIGMMHIGEADAYDSLFDGYPLEDTVILSEGVTDKTGALGHGTNYGGVAESLGLEEQKPMGDLTAIEERNADIDVSQFSEATLRILNFALLIHALKDSQAMFDAVMSMDEDILGDPDQILVTFRTDLIDLRNQNVLRETDGVLSEFEHVILPWGAIHMKGIEEGLLARGFEVRASKARPFLRWSTVWRAMTGA
jgi:hypothetical protein